MDVFVSESNNLGLGLSGSGSESYDYFQYCLLILWRRRATMGSERNGDGLYISVSSASMLRSADERPSKWSKVFESRICTCGIAVV